MLRAWVASFRGVSVQDDDLSDMNEGEASVGQAVDREIEESRNRGLKMPPMCECACAFKVEKDELNLLRRAPRPKSSNPKHRQIVPAVLWGSQPDRRAIALSHLRVDGI